MAKEKRSRVIVEFEYGSISDLNSVLMEIKNNCTTGRLSERILLPGGIYNFERQYIFEAEVREETINGKQCIIIKSSI